MSKNNAAVHVGRAEVLLRELVKRESVDINMKTPLVQKWARVFPVIQNSLDEQGVIAPQSTPLGIVKYKMRLRKPIQEVWRYHREKTEIDNMTAAVNMKPATGILKAQKKAVTISVIGCHDL